MWRQGVQLNSAATVTLQGEHFVHAAIFHRFAREPEQDAGWAPVPGVNRYNVGPSSLWWVMVGL